MTPKNFNDQIRAKHKKWIPGYLDGRRQPSVELGMIVIPEFAKQFQHASVQQQVQAFIQHWFQIIGSERPTSISVQDPKSWLTALGQCFDAGLQFLGFRYRDAVTVTAPTPDKPLYCITLPVPFVPNQLIIDTWQLVLAAGLQWFDRPSPAALQKFVLDKYSDIRQRLRAQAANPLFISAAHENAMPMLAITSKTLQYGQGCKSHWFEHTFTSTTVNNSVRLARDKESTTRRLRQAGLPTTVNQRAATVEQAQAFADKVGYPVVIKPLGKDGGLGVCANLSSLDELRQAYQATAQIDKTILIEKHVWGRDYRLTVLDGELLWAVERIPAGVTGDGTSTVMELIEQENQTTERRSGPRQTLKPLVVNAEAKQCLQKQQIALNSVPAAGQFVRLSSIANIATGGRPQAVTAEVHPDNVELAVRAARALRLDLAGIDVLIPDIRTSWRDSGAAICEVNAQPDLGATTAVHLYQKVLRARLKGNGRIPITVVVGGSRLSDSIDTLMHSFISQGYHLGYVDNTTVTCHTSAGNVDHLTTGQSPYQAGQMLLSDPTISAVLLHLSAQTNYQHGLPMDQYDTLFITEELPSVLAQALFKSARHHIVIDSNIAQWAQQYRDCVHEKCEVSESKLLEGRTLPSVAVPSMGIAP